MVDRSFASVLAMVIGVRREDLAELGTSWCCGVGRELGWWAWWGTDDEELRRENDVCWFEGEFVATVLKVSEASKGVK